MSDDALGLVSQPDFIEKEVSLAPYNTFRFDHKAQYFAIIDTLASLTQAIQWARYHDIPVTVIGGGSNLLVCDEVLGLVLVNQLMGLTQVAEDQDTIKLHVAAGENWHRLVAHTVEKEWYGIENLALIPGTVGAAPVQNIGAYGVEVKDALTRVQVFDVLTDELLWLDKGECGFAYRDSHFKTSWKGKYIITAVEMVLSKVATFSLQYGGLSQQLRGEITLSSVFETICRVRQAKLPDPQELANAGSFFKNPVVEKVLHDDLKAKYPELISFAVGDAYKLAAGWLIDHAGFKGKLHKGVGVYDKQALVLVNYSEHKADALLELESLIKTAVLEQYGVFLEREPVRLPASDAMTGICEGGRQ